MKSTRQLRLRLRLIEGALLLLLGTLTAGAVATRQLLLDAANHPTTDISLSSVHWIGTLDAARLPASVPLLDGNNALTAPGGFITSAGASLAGGNVTIDPDGNVGIRNLNVANNALINDQGTFIGNGVLISNGFSTDSNNFYTDGAGDAFVQNISVTGGVSTGGDLSASGSLIGQNLYVADATVADADGYTWTANQPYQDGTVTPTGYLTFKDATGNVFYVPAMHQP